MNRKDRRAQGIRGIKAGSNKVRKSPKVAPHPLARKEK